MKKSTKNLFIFSIVICLFLSLILTGCAQTPVSPAPPEPAPPLATAPGNTTRQGQTPGVPPATTTPGPSNEPLKPTSPAPPPPPAPTGAIIAHLAFSEPPILGKPVQIVATFSLWEGYKKEPTNTKAWINLHESFELVDGNLTWSGDLPRGSSVELKAIIKAIKTGESRIDSAAQAYSSDGGELTFGGTSIYAYVSENSAQVSDVPLGPKIGHGGSDTSPPPGWVPPPGFENLVPVPPSPPPANEPPAQEVPPVEVPSISPSEPESFSPKSGEKDYIQTYEHVYTKKCLYAWI